MQSLLSLAALLLNRWTTSFAGVAIAGLLVWYLGPLVPGLAAPLPRALAVLVLVLGAAGINGLLTWRRRRRDHRLAAAMTGTAADAAGSEAGAAEEVAELRVRMREALDRLQARRGGRELYERPWFVLIGPPGAGKTTALRNCGLHFPLDSQGRTSGTAIGGIGGTRLCDWWFTDEAILIDTAGRYTTQDSDPGLDRAGWLGFLDLLRQYRPRQPVNGVIVVLSLADFAGSDAPSRAAHARAVRRRIDEITSRLRQRVPVYVMFSKADQIAGFDAYFDDLDVEGRAQVWGSTFGLTEGVQAFAEEFRLLLERLQARLVERLQSERSSQRRAQIAGFPLQVASLVQPLNEFMLQAFTGSRLDPAPFLRGAYMSSATQEGTPVDRITGMLSRAFGVDQQRASSLQPVASRSYFVSRLLREVVLGEALLGSQAPDRIRRRRLWRIGGHATVGAATLLTALVLWRAGGINRAALEHNDEALAAYREQAAATDLDLVRHDDLAQVASLLDAARGLPRGHAGWLAGTPGLSQHDKLEQVDQVAYEHALGRILLPRLVWRLEQQMHQHFEDADFLYQATRVYLMLGSDGPLDPALVRNWLRSDWEDRYPGTLNAGLRARLLAHVDALLDQPLPPVSLDAALVEGARATFSRVTPAERVYGRLLGLDAARQITDWTVNGAIGPQAAAAFMRPSGKPLTEAIPGLLTTPGLERVLLPNLAATTQTVAQESWVLGRAQQIPVQGPGAAALEQAVLALWASDAERHWDTLLGDIALAPMGSREQAVQSLYVLSSPQSPIRDLLAAIARQVAPDKAGPADPATKGAALAGFDVHFQALRALTAAQPNAGAAPIDAVLHLVNQLQQEVAQAGPGNTPVAAALQGAGDPTQLLLAEAARQPAPLSQWLHQIAGAGTTSLGSAAQSAVSTAFAGSDGPGALCRSVVDRHFPFDPHASEDAPLDDFARLFAPGGVMDRFFQSQLAPFVDTSGKIWRQREVGGVAAPATSASIVQFQRADAIRDAFFPAGGNQPQLSLTILPAPDGVQSLAVLKIGSAAADTGGSDGSAMQVTWPGADGPGGASLSVAGKAVLQEDGPWALFRLLGHGRIGPTGTPGRDTVAFPITGGTARFTVRAGSSHDPIAPDLLSAFHCPVLR